MNRLKAVIYRIVADILPRVFFSSEFLDPTRRKSGKKILIACSYFWPSIGGVESRVEQFAAKLVDAGYDVSVITPDFPGRDSNTRNGVAILSIPARKRVYGLLRWPFAVRAAVTGDHYDVCILIQDPRGELLWCVENLPAHRRTRIFVQPIITAEGYDQWKHNKRFRSRLSRLLHVADVAVAMTRTGPDVRFMLGSGLSPICIPNATQKPEPEMGFREKYAIDAQAFVILHVANLWWYKNHCGLIDALNLIPASWKLVLIGNPTTEADCARAVSEKLAKRPEILHLSGLDRHDVSSAMAAADMVVLSSFGEGSPNTILEAMAHGKPWLATPLCGGASDNAGGIICPVGEFNNFVALLYENEELRHDLGRIGYRHWHACFSWEHVIEGWIDLIESGEMKQNYVMPSSVAADMSHARAVIQQALRSGFGNGCEMWPGGMATGTPATSVVNIGMITCNRLDFTRQAIEALAMVDAGYRFVLTVVDNGSADGTRDFLQELHLRGVVKNLVLLAENIGVAKASNLAWSLVPEAGYYLKLDNDIVIRKHGWLRDMVEVADRIAEAGAVAYNFEPASYPAVTLHGCGVRPKLDSNLGGACILIPRRTHELLGYWCEDYGLYGEEDADFGVRVECAGLFNLYMADEDVGLHLPSGRAARIGFGLRAKDGVEEIIHAEYRAWKDQARRKNMWYGAFESNLSGYTSGTRKLFLRSSFVDDWRERHSHDVALGPAGAATAFPGSGTGQG
jgi:glycosyltransferase involved in cell wall biosynthesis